MSDAPLTLSDLIRYLEAVGTGKGHCRSCNGTTFTLFAEPERGRVGLLGFQLPNFGDLSKAQTLEVVHSPAQTAGRCGCTNAHMLRRGLQQTLYIDPPVKGTGHDAQA